MSRRGQGARSSRRIQSGPPPFLPTRLPGLVLWLRADLGITLNGGNVSAWADQSGNGNHATQGTAANQPLYVSSGINGRPTVRFDGVNDVLSTTTGAVAGDHTIIIAGKWVALPSAVKGILAYGVGGAAGNSSTIGILDAANHNWYGYGGYGLPSGTVPNTSQHVWSKTYANTGPVTTGYYDGGSDATDNVRTFILGSAAIDVGAMTGSSLWSNFEFAELVIYRRVLTAAELQQNAQYMKARYATP